MSAVLDTVAQMARPADAAREFARLNDRLARQRTIPADIRDAVHDIASGLVDQTSLERWEAIDPYLALVIHRAVIQAQEAVLRRHEARARNQLRVALESLRQSFAAIGENESVADEHSPKQLARWLAETAEVSQSRLAELLGVSLRQFQRWLSQHETTEPEGDDARRVRSVARIVNQLRFVLTPTGAIEWFSWPRTDLDGATPKELLDANMLPQLTAIAGSMRATSAS
jgi:hypothetical protein